MSNFLLQHEYDKDHPEYSRVSCSTLLRDVPVCLNGVSGEVYISGNIMYVHAAPWIDSRDQSNWKSNRCRFPLID